MSRIFSKPEAHIGPERHHPGHARFALAGERPRQQLEAAAARSACPEPWARFARYRASVVALLLAAVLIPSIAVALPTEAELKERFRARVSAIDRLKDAGQIGETIEGEIAAVDRSVLSQEVKLDDGRRIAVRDLVAEENRDRTLLYRLIAERTDATPEAVAQQNAIRNYQNAAPHHYLRTKQGEWKKKASISSRR